jgi:chemotaxis protein methyltransferase CheR
MPYFSESPTLSQSAFSILRDLIHERLGLYYSDDRREILQDRLAPLALERGCHSFLDYYYILKYDPDAPAEWLRVQSALAVRETYFWREVDQVRAVAEIIIPQWRQAGRAHPIRIWHAACASGEEPYSMAIALKESGVSPSDAIEIVASDFDQVSLELARRGVYGERSFRALPPELRAKYFHPLENGHLQINRDGLKAIQWMYLNLADEAAMQTMRGFDVIFCRNVFIYFSDKVIERVANHLYNALHPGGYLCLGAAESLLRVSTPFELVEVNKTFMYHRPASSG